MKLVNREDLLNLWLKYHNTNVNEVISKHSKEELDNPNWFLLYPVTQEQHDEWVVEAKKMIKKVTKLPNKVIDKNFGMVYLDCSPSVLIK